MFTIRKILREDSAKVLKMMRTFYNSSAVITNGSEKIFAANIENFLGGSNFIEGFVFLADEKVIGYGMLAKSYSTEFGGECIWIEDIFIEAEYRGRGYGSKFIEFVKEMYPDKILRLETEHENLKALSVYKNFGFKELPYLELVLVKD